MGAQKELKYTKILKWETSNQEYTVFPIYFKFCTVTFRAHRTCTAMTATTYFDIHKTYMGTTQSKNLGATVMCPQSETTRSEICIPLSLLSKLLMA
jgi:hypothetical protein